MEGEHAAEGGDRLDADDDPRSAELDEFSLKLEDLNVDLGPLGLLLDR
jgi:hypothetical protein